eukprot:14801323-Alexandrium_andersonii.AAC.1
MGTELVGTQRGLRASGARTDIPLELSFAKVGLESYGVLSEGLRTAPWGSAISVTKECALAR